MRSFLLTEGLKLVTYTWLLSELNAVVRSKIKFLFLFSYTKGNLHTYVILFSVVVFVFFFSVVIGLILLLEVLS